MGKEKLVPTGGEQQPGASEKGGKNKTGRRTIINSRKIHTHKILFSFCQWVGRRPSVKWEGRSWWRRKRTNKNTSSFFLSLSLYWGLLNSLILSVLHSWGWWWWWWWGLGYCRPGGFIRDNTNTHATHSRTCERRHPLSQILFLLLFRCVCLCYLLFLSLVLFPILHADCARGAPRSSVKRLSVKKIKKTRDEEEDGRERKEKHKKFHFWNTFERECVCFSQGGSTYYVRGPTIHHRAIYRGNGGPNGSPRTRRFSDPSHTAGVCRRCWLPTLISPFLSLLAASTLNSRGTWTSNDSHTASQNWWTQTQIFIFRDLGKFVVV